MCLASRQESHQSIPEARRPLAYTYAYTCVSERGLTPFCIMSESQRSTHARSIPSRPASSLTVSYQIPVFFGIVSERHSRKVVRIVDQMPGPLTQGRSPPCRPLLDGHVTDTRIFRYSE
jgi:hypothetical protein